MFEVRKPIPRLLPWLTPMQRCFFHILKLVPNSRRLDGRSSSSFHSRGICLRHGRSGAWGMLYNLPRCMTTYRALNAEVRFVRKGSIDTPIHHPHRSPICCESAGTSPHTPLADTATRTCAYPSVYLYPGRIVVPLSNSAFSPTPPALHLQLPDKEPTQVRKPQQPPLLLQGWIRACTFRHTTLVNLSQRRR